TYKGKYSEVDVRYDDQNEVVDPPDSRPMTTASNGSNHTSTLTGLSIEAKLLIGLMSLAVVYTLSVAQKFLIPVALSFLLSLVLAPVVRWLEQLHVPRPAGAGVIVLVMVAGFSYGVSGSVAPVSNWVEYAPRVLRQLELKIYPIKKTVEVVSETAEQVDRIASVNPKPTVQVSELSFREVLYVNTQGLVTGTVMVTFLLYFLLSWGRIVLFRIARLLHEHGARRQFLALSAILEGEVSKYLATIALINFCLGIIVAAVLFAFGMPNPLLWGAAAALFNFIPYLGGMITAVLLGATALLTFDGFTVPALVVASFIGLTIIEGQIVTPLILGKRLALNPLVVFLSVVFLFWLWGVLGALM
ncbi:MAG: AI-2E family transporter, partial [Anaerolineae bacterium]|nr:AI-2E family transporter [Anaerolineae bacterium]